MLKKYISIASMAILTAVVLYFGDYKVNNIKIIVDGVEQNISTYKSDLNEVLRSKNIKLRENDYINVDKLRPVEDQSIIIIKTATEIKIIVEGKEYNYITYADTVEELLKERNIKYDTDDIIKPQLNNKITEDMVVKVDKVKEKIVTTYDEIPFGSEIKYNKKIYIGQKNILQKGSNGLTEIKKKQRYVNGLLQCEALISKVNTKEPINEVIEKGSKPKLVVSRSGVNFKRSIIMKATAYDLTYASTGKRPGDKHYGITASGMKARRGVVAVDPKVIPLGTKLYIESLDGSKNYGYAIAGDTGSAIKGNRIDLFYDDPNFVKKFGVRKVKVYIK
ncbi:3D domain-containing protein [Clostridiaceae bacterium M8S5]|nr:3D domain-containing protein [Clostridiaceae bacterium M8S5]